MASTEDEPQVPPSPGRPLPSLRPALTVVALALAIVLLGSVLALVGSASAHPSTPAGPVHHLAGSKLEAEPAKAFLAHIEASGEPPADIVSALYVPAGSRYLGRARESRGLSQYDSSIRLSVPAPEHQVSKFFELALSAGHWTTNSVTSPRKGSSELIAERSGSDGYQWRVGIITTGVRTYVAPALAGGSESPARTRVSIELYQVEDAS